MERTSQITKLCEKGLSLREIAKEIGTSPNTVSYWLKKLGLKTKTAHDKEGHKTPKHIDCIGKTYHYLKILSFTRKKGVKGYYAKCLCTLCGNKTVKFFSSVLRGATTSCGCRTDQYEKLRGKNSSQYTGYEDITGRTWSKIKRGAKNRGLSFNLNLKDAWELFLKQDKKCIYTGIPLVFGRSGHNKETTASIDRIDSSKGYTKENIQ